MRDNALYFPYISVPNEAWTMKALFYWDRLSSIVPMEYMHSPEKLSPFMRDLVEEDLVRQIAPAHYVYQIPQLSRSFIAMVEAREERKRTRLTPGIVKPRTQIHMEKLGDIPYYLIERGLANLGQYPWFEVDEDIAQLFMAYLAACLGAIPEINAAPVTNKALFSAAKLSHRLHQQQDGVHRWKARDTILHALLPTPAGKIELAEMVRFKRAHGHLLPALRRKIEAQSAAIAILPKSDDRLSATEEFIAKSKLEVDEIIDAMKPTWDKITMGSLIPIFGSGLALYATETGNKVAYAGSALSFVGAAYQAISSIRENKDQLMKRPLAYLAHSRIRF